MKVIHFKGAAFRHLDDGKVEMMPPYFYDRKAKNVVLVLMVVDIIFTCFCILPANDLVACVLFATLPISAIFAYFGYHRESCPIIYLHMVCSTSLLVILPWLIWNPNIEFGENNVKKLQEWFNLGNMLRVYLFFGGSILTHCFMLPASLKMFTYAGMNEKITEALKDKEFVKKIGKPDDEYRPPSPLFF
ncbi:hypothetical protein L5515_004749 [Caenorhabditis briggsae]|uniref:Uncharacterized protein n=1 Tax=Caenorhabditis briggsae TaxID=6238 RepID=A0AAE9EMR6_CAEBR|nr:hypothetical protein L5515_004749 [Caenorhabditis briggsae]